jgi:hypothetical protein
MDSCYKEDQMNLESYLKLAYWNDPIARQYNVAAAIPPASF